jgi:hypothetical protein
MRQLSGSDAFFLYSDKPGRHQHLSTIYLYDPSSAPGGVVDFRTILDHVRERIGTSRIFRQRLVEVPLNVDYPYWIYDDHFDLEFHVRHIALPEPGDWRQFCITSSTGSTMFRGSRRAPSRCWSRFTTWRWTT